MFCLYWTYIWNILWRLSLYVSILHGLLSCDSSPICKKSLSCLCTQLHCWWWFGMPLDYELFLLPKVFLEYVLPCMQLIHFITIFINIWFAIRRLNKYILYGKGMSVLYCSVCNFIPFLCQLSGTLNKYYFSVMLIPFHYSHNLLPYVL